MSAWCCRLNGFVNVFGGGGPMPEGLGRLGPRDASVGLDMACTMGTRRIELCVSVIRKREIGEHCVRTPQEESMT